MMDLLEDKVIARSMNNKGIYITHDNKGINVDIPVYLSQYQHPRSHSRRLMRT